MLSGLERRGQALADRAQARAIADAAGSLRTAFPDLTVTAQAGGIALTGHISPEDARLRWIGILLR